jgi:hypothetical protein
MSDRAATLGSASPDVEAASSMSTCRRISARLLLERIHPSGMSPSLVMRPQWITGSDEVGFKRSLSATRSCTASRPRPPRALRSVRIGVSTSPVERERRAVMSGGCFAV